MNKTGILHSPNPLPKSSWREQHVPERLVVINDSSVARGGATAVALASIELLSSRGCPVTFIAGDDASEYAKHHPKVDVVSISGEHILKGSRTAAAVRGLYNALAQRVVSRWIAENDTPATVYHLHGWSKILSPAIFKALQPVMERLVITAHDFFLACPNGGYFDFQAGHPCERKPLSVSCLACHCDRRSYAQKIWRASRHVVRQVFYDGATSAATVLAVHDRMLPHLQLGGINPLRLRALRNPVVPWRSERITAERNRVFVFVGRLDTDKGVDLLAKSARRAGVPLRIIGDGPLMTSLRSEFPNVEFLGWKSRTEIGALIADARVLVMPTRYREAFGLVALEALTSGLPVVVPENSMIAEDVAAEGVGVTCDPLNEDDFSRTLRHLADDDDFVATASVRAFNRAGRLAPTPDEWATSLADIYQGLTSAELK